MLYQNITETIGNTPLIRVNQKDQDSADLYVKVESFNPAGSIKDRPAYYMIKAAEEKGILKKGDTIIEATSGNTGIALSMIGAALGYQVVIVMPETMSVERQRLMKAYGAKLILTPGSIGMSGAVAEAEKLAQEQGYFMAKQFENPANVLSHEETTAKEILKDLNGKVDAFVAGVGTGGTITGISKVLKAQQPHVLTVALQPEKSPILTGGKPGPHGIQGIGANFVPDIYQAEFVDRVLSVTEKEAYEGARELGSEEGILAGISSGANYAMAKKIAKELGKGKVVVTVLPDTGERYLSTDLFAEI